MRGEDMSQMKQIEVHFYMSHVNGYTFRLQPNRNFVGLPAGQSEILRITGGGWSVSRSEVCYISTECHPQNTPPVLLHYQHWSTWVMYNSRQLTR